MLRGQIIQNNEGKAKGSVLRAIPDGQSLKWGSPEEEKACRDQCRYNSSWWKTCMGRKWI
jgi:hypothetical protein